MSTRPRSGSRLRAAWQRTLVAIAVLALALPLTPLTPSPAAIAAPGEAAAIYLGRSVEGEVVGSYKSAQALRECPSNEVMIGARTENRGPGGRANANSILTRFDILCAQATVTNAGTIALTNQHWQTYPTFDESRNNIREGVCPAGTVVHRMTGITFLGSEPERWPSQVTLECRTLGFNVDGQIRVNQSIPATQLAVGENFNSNGGLQHPAFQCGGTTTNGWSTGVVRGYRPQNGGEGIDGFNPSCAVMPVDFGDAPQTYGSARHELNGATYLGWSVDPEPSEQYSAAANADDTPGGTAPNLMIDDENGLVSELTPIVAGLTDTYSAEVYVTNKLTDQEASLVGWIDFDHDGDFDEAEAAIAVIAPGTRDGSTVTLTWTGIAAQSAGTGGQTFARFRISSDPNLTASTPTGPLANGEAEDHAMQITPFRPKLTIAKTSNVTEVKAAGDTIRYSFLVTNTGNQPLTDVAPVEGEFTGSGTLGAISPASVNLAPSEAATFTADYTVTQEDIDAGGVTNAATATGTPPGTGTLTPPPISRIEVPAVPTPALTLEKTATPSDAEAFRVGQVISYDFLLTNTGNVTLRDVAPAESSFSGTGDLGPITPESVTLAPGESRHFGADYTLTQEDVDAGRVTNVATGHGTPPSGPPIDAPPSEFEVPIVPNPALSIEKSASPSDPDSFRVGQEITYTFVLTNIGNVTLRDIAPVEAEFSGTGDLGPVTPVSATLAQGESATFTASYTLTQEDVDAGQVTNVAVGYGVPPSGPPIDAPPSEIEIPVTPAPELSVEKTSDTVSISAPGEVISYTFVVTNTGNVTLTNVVPVEAEFSGSGELGDLSPESATLAPGEAATFTAEYVVTQADIDAGGVTNTATATGTPPGTTEFTPPPVSRVEVPSIPEPGLEVVKSADLVDRTDFRAGETVTYLFRVTNTGNVTMHDVAPVEGEFSGTGKIGDLTPASASLAPGEIAMFTAPYTLTQADVDSGVVTNTATVTGVPPTGPPVTSPPSTTEVPTPATPAIAVLKSSDTQTLRTVGQKVTYTFAVTNTGNVTLRDVAPVEGEFSGTGRIGALTPASATVAPGETVTFTASYTATAADLTGSPLRNTATAVGTPPGGGVIVSTPSTVEINTVVVPDPGPGLAVTGAQFAAGGIALAAVALLLGGTLVFRRRAQHRE